MKKKQSVKVSVIVFSIVFLFSFLFFVDIIIRNNSYYDIRKYSFTWFWLFPKVGTLRGFPILKPAGEVMYNYRGLESNTLDMEEYQIEYASNANYKQILDTSIRYLEEKGYSLELTNAVDCTWELPSNANNSTLYYKDITQNKDWCLTFVITQGDNNLTYVKLFMMR